MNSGIEKAIIFIAQNFAERIAVKDLAKVANLSEFHFFRLFKKHLGISPQRYLEKLRLEHACHLMVLYPNWSVTQIAFECGFSSPSYFNQVFK